MVALSKRSRTQVYSGKRSGSSGKITVCLCVRVLLCTCVLMSTYLCMYIALYCDILADVSTLFDLALKVLMNNINGMDSYYPEVCRDYRYMLVVLEEVKGVPYRIMEPVLAR